MSELVTTQLARLITENPDLPVRVIVSSGSYNGENENYDVGEIAWCMVDEEYWGKEFLHYKFAEDYEETLWDACKKGDIPYTRGGFKLENYCDEEIEQMYNSLPWKECIVVCVE